MTFAAQTLLLDHQRNLRRVIADDAFPSTTRMARRYLARVNSDLAKPMPDLTAGKWGANGLAPAVADVVAQAEWHKANTQMEGEK